MQAHADQPGKTAGKTGGKTGGKAEGKAGGKTGGKARGVSHAAPLAQGTYTTMFAAGGRRWRPMEINGIRWSSPKITVDRQSVLTETRQVGPERADNCPTMVINGEGTVLWSQLEQVPDGLRFHAHQLRRLGGLQVPRLDHVGCGSGPLLQLQQAQHLEQKRETTRDHARSPKISSRCSEI